MNSILLSESQKFHRLRWLWSMDFSKTNNLLDMVSAMFHCRSRLTSNYTTQLEQTAKQPS
jgi:hypothetical protein